METGEVSFTKQVKSELSARSYTTEEKKSLLTELSFRLEANLLWN